MIGRALVLDSGRAGPLKGSSRAYGLSRKVATTDSDHPEQT